MLVSRAPIRREIPHEEGAWFDFVRLSWKQIRDAKRAAEKEGRAVMKELGAEFINALRDDDVAKVRRVMDEQEWDPRAFDTESTLNIGVVAWSYEFEVTPEQLARLDKPTAAWAVQTIIDISRSPTAAEEKNDSPSSSAP